MWIAISILGFALVAGPTGMINTDAGAVPWAEPAKKNPAGRPVVRWDRNDPECSLARGNDGVDRYSLSYEALAVTMAVDNQELEKTRRTLEHVFRIWLTFRNRGTVPIDIDSGHMTLELVEHFHVRMAAEDPDELAYHIQDDSDELVHQSERELKHHPERKSIVEARLREHEKLVTEWLEFLTTKALRPATLDTGQPELTGLVLFPTKTKWKGQWKKKEDFLLRIPMKDAIFEFPFTLPPAGEEPILRQRSED